MNERLKVATETMAAILITRGEDVDQKKRGEAVGIMAQDAFTYADALIAEGRKGEGKERETCLNCGGDPSVDEDALPVENIKGKRCSECGLFANEVWEHKSLCSEYAPF